MLCVACSGSHHRVAPPVATTTNASTTSRQPNAKSRPPTTIANKTSGAASEATAASHSTTAASPPTSSVPIHAPVLGRPCSHLGATAADAHGQVMTCVNHSTPGEHFRVGYVHWGFPITSVPVIVVKPRI